MLIPACINNFEFIGNYETVLEVSSSQFSYKQRTSLYPSQTGRCVPMTINIGYTINRQNAGIQSSIGLYSSDMQITLMRHSGKLEE